MPKNSSIAIGLLAIFIVIMNVVFAPANILSWDVFGYYLYLPATFIYHDLGLANQDVILEIIEKYNNTATFYQAMKMSENVWVMKYSMGMSVLYAPFFCIGWAIATVTDYPVDGFSAPFQYAIFTGGILYSLLGIWFTAKVLNKFFSEKVTIISLVLIVFATNYLVHISMYGQNAMSQNYLFTGYALVLWFTIRWHETYKLKYMGLVAIISGLMVLSRPTEIVVLLIPVLWGIFNKETLINKLNLLREHKIQVLVFAVIIGCIGSWQFIYWKLFAGKFLFNSYGANAGEGLDLFSPYTYKFLFSFRKGWFIYTPIMLISMAGFYFMYKKNKAIFFALFGYFVMNLWLVSSWSNWWYAQSFSQRAMVSSYPIMAIALGYFITWLFTQKWSIKIPGVILIVFLTGLNLFQTKQFHRGVLHGDRMTKEYYFAVFGKLNASEEDKKLLLVDRNFDKEENFDNSQDYAKKVVYQLDFDSGDGNEVDNSHSGCCSIELNSENKYSPYFEAEYQEITKKDHAWIRVSAYVFPTEKDIEQDNFGLAVNFFYNGYPYKYKTRMSKAAHLEPNQWNKMEFDYLTPEVRTKSDKFRALVLYNGSEKLLVDDFKVEIFEKK